MFYAIDLTKQAPEIGLLEPSEARKAMILLNCSTLKEIDSPDIRVFKTEFQALKFMTLYNYTKKTLSKTKMKSIPKMPKILYKRRYLIQTLMGKKNQTVRKYDKQWKKGTEFQLYDQTYFVTVKLTAPIEKTDAGYVYKFKLVK